MSIYRKYTIKANEDLRTIAQKLYGNADLWIKLATLNHLKTPYIVATPEEQAKDPEHLLMWGQKLLLPNGNDVYEDNANLIEDSNTAHYRDEYYDTTLGMDLNLDISTDTPLSEQLGVLPSNGTTFKVVRGLDNLKQSLILRILTRQGTLLLHPEYGSKIPNMIGRPINDKLKQEIAVELGRVITTDTRVSECSITRAKVAYNEMFFDIEVIPINYEESFKLYLYRSKTGQISLR